MLKTYFKTAWRSIIRGRVYSVLNILGLATGMAVALLIGLWVYDQYSYDRFLPGYQQAYQLKFTRENNGEKRTQKDVCLPLEGVLRQDVAEVAYVSPAFGPVDNEMAAGEKKLLPHGLIVGHDFLKIFRFPVLQGSAEGALKDPSCMVLTESLARALFGRIDVVNRIVRVDNEDRRVTAVLADPPSHSSLQFRYLGLFDEVGATGWVKAATTNWAHDFFTVYASLKPNVSYAQVEPKIRLLVKKYAPAIYASTKEEVTMQPMQDWRLYTEYKNGVAVGGLIDYIRLFSITGFLVLLIACINFMNLSTARSEKRAREVGVRKTLGSGRSALILQFLAESVLMTILSFFVALLMLQLALPAFDALTKTTIRLPWGNGRFWIMMFSYVLVTGLLAGSRPAFYLSSFQPVKVLKGKLPTGGAAALSRKVLVVLQFTCSIALIISTMTVYQQIAYARSRPTGYDPDRLITSGSSYYSYHALKREALQSGVITSMTNCNANVTDISAHDPIDNWEGHLPNESLTLTMNSMADTDYFRTLGTPFVAGRNFTGNYGRDSLDVVLNEAAVKRMRFKQPIGEMISWSIANAPARLRVVGVVKDALTKSPFTPVEPTMFVYQPDWCFTLMYRLSPNTSTAVAMGKLKAIFEKNDPSHPYEYHFIDELYAAQFDLELLTGRLAGIFAGLAVFISCLGLFGLAAYMAEQRTKEIGIRKVLGASVTQVVALLGKDFIVLVLISCVVASPIAYYFLYNWLQGYYYRISIGPGVFVLAGMMAVVVTAVTISLQSVRAALMNPVESLRSE